MSVFEHPMVVNGPDFDEICYVLYLEDNEGRGAGLLRLINNADVELGSQIELIVISSGSASH